MFKRRRCKGGNDSVREEPSKTSGIERSNQQVAIMGNGRIQRSWHQGESSWKSGSSSWLIADLHWHGLHAGSGTVTILELFCAFSLLDQFNSGPNYLLVINWAVEKVRRNASAVYGGLIEKCNTLFFMSKCARERVPVCGIGRESTVSVSILLWQGQKRVPSVLNKSCWNIKFTPGAVKIKIKSYKINLTKSSKT